MALVALPALACREPATSRLADAPEKPVVCDLEKWRAEMPRLEQQCAQGVAKSCFVLGTLVHGRPWCGPVTPQPDRIRAWGLFEKACMLGEEEGCIALGNGAGTRWRVDAPVAQLEEGCSADVGYACYLRGQRIKEDFWDSLPPESAEETIRDGLRTAMRNAHPWFERACARGVQEGCFEEAFLVMYGPNPERAVTLLEQACGDWRANRKPVVGSVLSCLSLAEAYEEAYGDRPRAHALRHDVCREDQLCNALYLVASSDHRAWLWSLEYTAAAATNGLALWLMRRRRPTAKWHFPLLLAVATLAGLSIAWELWYYFTGSPWQSTAWWAVAPVPVVLPLWFWIRQLHSPHVTSDV